MIKIALPTNTWEINFCKALHVELLSINLTRSGYGLMEKLTKMFSVSQKNVES